MRLKSLISKTQNLNRPELNNNGYRPPTPNFEIEYHANNYSGFGDIFV